MDNFKIVIITNPDAVENEADKIVKLLEAGVDYVHIRKPAWSLRDVRNLIEEIPYPLRKRLKLHGHYELLNEMSLGGVHLNSRNPVAPATALSVSKSCHTIKEIEDVHNYEYVTLSPIFDSISKSDYKGKFKPPSLKDKIKGRRVIALGGVHPELFLTLRQNEFHGAALLGYIWNGDFDTSLVRLAEAMKTRQ